MAAVQTSPPAAKRLKLDSDPVSPAASSSRINGHTNGHSGPIGGATATPPPPPPATSAPPLPVQGAATVGADADEDEDEAEDIAPIEEEDVGRQDMYLDTVSPLSELPINRPADRSGFATELGL